MTSTLNRPKAPGRFARVATWTIRHRAPALGLWIVALVAIVAAAAAAGDSFRDEFELPGSQSQEVADVLAAGGREAADTVTVVLHDPAGVSQARTADLLGTLAELDFVAGADEPVASADRTTSFAEVRLDTEPPDTDLADVRVLIDRAQAAAGDGLQVELGGDSVREARESGGPAEGIGLLAALLILLPLFGSLLAASLPIVTAVFAVGSSIALITLTSHVATVPSYAVPMMALVGLGVGIDYALLVFSRFRTEVLDGSDHATATARALDTAGRSVLFAGCTVIIALLGLLVLGLGALQGLALSVALTVLMTIVASLTLLPALLSLFGRRLEATVLRRASRRSRRHGDAWRRWAGLVQRRPLAALVSSVGVLVLLTLPVLDIRLGFADAGTDAPESTSRRAYDLLSAGFGPGSNGPLVVVAEGDAGPDRVMGALAAADGVASVIPAGEFPTTVLVTPEGGPAARSTTDLVHRLRDDVLPELSRQTGGTYLVGGSTPASIDFSDAVGQRLPWFIAAVVGLSSLLLMVVFRSVLIPLKAAILNLLSIGAALGVMTYVFGEGNLGAQPGPIEAFLPVIVFAVVFGLSMDYEVFLVSRIHEEWRRTADAQASVREGLAMTGGVITAAAAIMVVVFGAFVASGDRMLQQMGLGLAVAVLLDALVIRCLLVPAAMRLLGERAWWFPQPFARVLPEVRLESGAR